MFFQESGRFYIRIEERFESSHYLYKYFPDGSDEPIHGHSWKVELYLSGKKISGTMESVLIFSLPNKNSKNL
ncbi:6-pyruvoyl tetrahydropterin synthase domain protein [Leptospira interrogans serovar Grippotyphosa str. LT2186]|uniref:6-carboxy-5,6,7,8-tetrahydropterin synthase n=2 Tax=Leptospira interrogans TaxID=173 RepID=M3FYV2_LEPIR|nr:6-pyruvoyl tetrahydropterin synthase domain protein [Leptospira interrogans serovar Grippotyphosa str. LT2186]EMP09362.1 6-pyruvoyl tetrahydropterin synthase domain protein [Leptospira interrogans serovar Pyrogenes str. 200701872]